jgi:hypothetical protein
MAVELKLIQPKDPDVRQLQQNVSDALQGCQPEGGSRIGVLSVSANTKLTGNEDVVLVDAGSATAEISLILPGVKVLRRALTVKITRAGSFPVVVKAVDIPSTSSPRIDGENQVTVDGKLTVISTGRAFQTI